MNFLTLQVKNFRFALLAEIWLFENVYTIVLYIVTEYRGSNKENKKIIFKKLDFCSK